VAGIALGVVAFREKVPASPLLIALQVAGLIALVAGVILVARSPVLASLRQYHGPGEQLLHPETLLRRENPIRGEHLRRHEHRRHRDGDRHPQPSADSDDPSGAARPDLAGNVAANTGPADAEPGLTANAVASTSPAGRESVLPATPAEPAPPAAPAMPGQAGSELGDVPRSLRR
jgi:hypothetical protein